jgi:hypothetical protein
LSDLGDGCEAPCLRKLEGTLNWADVGLQFRSPQGMSARSGGAERWRSERHGGRCLWQSR